MKFARIVALLILTLTTAASAVPTQVRAPAAPSRAEQLNIMADFFVPRTPLFAISREMCDTAYRTSLTGQSEMPEIEKTLPGIVDRMVKASSTHCDVEMNKVLDARQDQVRTYLTTQLSPADLARLARLLAASVQEIRDLKIAVNPGDTIQQIAARLTPDPDWDRRLRTAQVAFAKTPGGVALINKVHAYQLTMKPLLEQDQKAMIAIGTASFKLAHREANLYAQEQGMQELYADAPVPPLVPAIAGTTSAKLGGAFLYVYSFLDVRQDEFTPKVLDRFDADLTARLSAVDVSSKILRFAQSSRGQEEFYARKTAEGSESRSVPVSETIRRNLTEERAAKARFRLIVFPDNFTFSGSWRFYDIRFILVDAMSNREIWNYTYSGKHLVLLKNSENAEARSKKILDHAFAELKAKGFL